MADPGSHEVGKAHVEVSADNSKLDAKIGEAKAKVEELGESSKKTGNRFSESFKRAGEAASKFQSVVSKIAIPVAVIGSLASVIRLFGRAKEEADAFREAAEASVKSVTDALANEVRQVRAIGDIEARRTELQAERVDKVQEENDKLADQLKKQDELFGVESLIIGRSVNNLLRATGLRASLFEMEQNTVDAIKGINDAQQQRITLLDQEVARRKAIADQQAKEFENQTKLLEAQARGQEAFIGEQLTQLAEEYRQKIGEAEDQAIADALKRRFWAMRSILAQQLQDIETAKQADIKATMEADAEKRKREDEAHQKAMDDIRKRRDAELQALEDILRRTEEGFANLNKDLVVGLGGVATALQQIGSQRNRTPMTTGGGR